MKTIENSKDYDTLIEQGQPILLDFYADWCGLVSHYYQP